MKKLAYSLIAILFGLSNFVLQAQEKPAPALLGGTFPDFKLISNEGKEVALSDYKNKNLMLVFPRGKVRDDYWCGICHYQYAELAKLEIEKKIRKKLNLEILFVLPYNKDSIDKWIEYMPQSMASIEKWKNPENPDDEKQKKWAEVVKKTCPQTITYKDGKYPLPLPVLIDDNHVLSSKIDIYREEWGGTKTGQNIPSIFILDGQGNVKFKFLGQNTFDRPHADYLAEFVEKLM